MPCVLPVLAIKLAAIIDSSGQSRGLVRMRFAAGAVGILASFGVVALGLAILRFGGGQIGWGIQYQSPIFLMMMMFVLGLFTLNMLDRFFLPVPSFLAVPSSLQALDRSGPNGTANHASRKLLAGDFIAGMLATLLATPCSAPFVGSAVTVALSGDTLQLFGILMVMGTGLAAPWMMVALIPRLCPVPAKTWAMDGLVKTWTCRITDGNNGLDRMVISGCPRRHCSDLIICIIGLGLLTVLWRPRFVTLIAVAGLLACMWALPPPAVLTRHRQLGLSGSLGQKMPAGRRKMMASWFFWISPLIGVSPVRPISDLCLRREPVAGMLAKLLDDRRLVMLQADWTRSDPRISAFLASHQRFGIPFNIIYGPAAPNGIVLGELLGARMIEKALIDAGMTR